MKPRNHAFDLLCGICILRMITLHVAGMCGFRGDYWCERMMAWTFFFMSFFFFKAGYFNKTVAGDSWAYVKDKTKRLLVPYLSWAVIGNALFFGLMLFNLPLFQTFFDKRFSVEHLWTTSRVYGNAPLWFLFSFYVAYLAMHFIGKVRHLRWIIVAFPFISYWLYTLDNPLWMSLNNVFLGIFFFFLGRLWRWVVDRVKDSRQTGQPHNHATLKRVLFLLVCVLMLVAFFYVNRYRHGEYDMSLNNYVQHADGAIVSTVLALCGVSGILLLLPQRRVPLVNYIGEHSMVYFVAHYPLILLYHLVHRLFGHTIRGHWDEFILIMLFVLITCTFLVPLVEKVPILSGRWKKKA